jgi:hypothetical protein
VLSLAWSLSVAPAVAADRCGGAEMRACKAWERIPACDPGLYEDVGRGRCVRAASAAPAPPLDCGRENGRPCYITERIPSCNPGLMEDFLAHKCIAGKSHLLGKARAALMDATTTRIMKALVSHASCFDAAQLIQAVAARNAAYALNLKTLPCLQSLAAVAAAAGYNTLTVGVTGSGPSILGANSEMGIGFDTHGASAPTFYSTAGYALGVQDGATPALALGVSIKLNRPGTVAGTMDGFGGSHQGIEAEYAAADGSGVIANFDDDDQFLGVTMTITAGDELDAGAYVRTTTAVLALP